MKKVERARTTAENGTGYEALRSMLKGEYTEESTGARTIRQSGGKDRHSKVFTSRGPRDRRVRLSVATAIRFYDLQDRLGFDQPSKAVEWLLLHCQTSIQALPQLATLHPSHSIASGQQAPYCSSQHKLFTFQAKPASRLQLQSSTSSLPSSLCQFTPSSNHASSNHAQISLQEDPPQYSNPSSSGASSDNPLTPFDGLYPNPLAFSKPLAQTDQKALAFLSQPTSSSSRPTCHYANKRKRMQIPLLNTPHHTPVQADDYASSTTNCIERFDSHAIPLHQDLSNYLQAEKLIDMFNETLFSNRSSVHLDKHYAGTSSTNNNKTVHISNSLQNQPSFTGQQASKISSSSAIDELNHVHTTQIFCDGQQSSQINGHPLAQQLMENLCSMHSLTDAGAYHADNAMVQFDAGREAYDNIDALNNVYTIPSPAESTSISRLGGNYSRAGNIVINNQAQDNPYRQCWPSVPNNLFKAGSF